jgi:hypothetical protein
MTAETFLLILTFVLIVIVVILAVAVRFLMRLLELVAGRVNSIHVG